MPNENTPTAPAPAPAPAPATAPAPSPAPAPAPAPANPAPAGNPAPAPAPNPAPGGQPAAGTTAPPPEEVRAGDWPDDWREKLSKGDEKAAKKLSRYGSPQAAIDALFAAQARISSGELKAPLKDDATPEELAAWRADNNIPEKPADYKLELSDGLVVGEADRPLVDSFLEYAHGKNMDNGTVNAAVDWLFSQQAALVEQQNEADANRRVNTFEAMREEFGPQYKEEIKIAMDALDSMPKDIRETFLQGRLPDGTRVGDSPAVIRWLNSMQRIINPIGTVVPGSGVNAANAMADEIATIEGMMGDRSGPYWKGPKAETYQARYRELISARDKVKG